MLRNSSSDFGLVSQLLHWLLALVMIFMLLSGLYMVLLDYYHPWYNRLPNLHKSFGVTGFVVLVLLLVWRLFSVHPEAVACHKRWEWVLSKIVHGLLLIAILVLSVSGYAIVTAKGAALQVFDWFSLAAVAEYSEQASLNLALLHQLFAYGMAVLIVLHIMGALKHHFIDGDKTLMRMLILNFKRGLKNENH